MNNDPAWLMKMAELEDGCDVSVGGMEHAELLKRLCTPGAEPPEYDISECAGSHTKGPWRGTQPAGGFANLEDQNGDLIFALAYPSLAMKDRARPSEECEANYRLLICAPDLLEAAARLVEEVRRTCTAYEGSTLLEAVSDAQQVIARASGR